jgi:hypothetical protein
VEVELTKFTFSKTVKMNENLEFSFVIKAKKDANLVVNYVINFVNKSRKAASKKTFKLKNLSAKNSQEILLSKRHKLRDNMTTRRLYFGTHGLEIMVNGEILQKCEFELR